jgi:Na+/proline symporter
MKSNGEGSRVSTLSRVLAWIFLACGALVLVDMVVRMFLYRSLPMSPGEAVLLGVGLLLICPLFLFVALKGRSPRWITSLENLHDDEARRRGIREPGTNPPRRLIGGLASGVFGVLLIVFGNELGIFSGETGWFAMAVFGLAWLIVAAILWRNYRPGAPVEGDNAADPKK